MVAKVNKEECTGCGTCVDECPVEAIIIDEDEGCAVVDEDE
ncbi:ferredoxin, partial [Methanosarcina mazei]